MTPSSTTSLVPPPRVATTGRPPQLASAIAAMGYRVAVRPTLLDDLAAAREVAAAALDLLRQPAAA